MDFSEKWGRDVEEAVNLALKDLNLEINQVEVIVLEEPSKGFFGIGSKLAKVRVQRLKEESNYKKVLDKKDSKKAEIAEKKDKKASQKIEIKEEKKTKRKPRVQTNNKVVIREKPDNLQEIHESPALDFLKEVTEKMGLEFTFKAFANEDCLYIEIFGKDSGTIIGKRGQTLDSIQYLTSLVVNKDAENYTRVILDAENYRSKREKTLEQLASRLAEKVERTGKNVRLEPMNPYERKVIHSTLQTNTAVTTRSEGEEPYRRVIIEQK